MGCLSRAKKLVKDSRGALPWVLVPHTQSPSAFYVFKLENNSIYWGAIRKMETVIAGPVVTGWGVMV